MSKSKALGNAVDTAFCDGACACLVLRGQQAKNSVAVCERFCSRSKNTCKSVYGEDISFLMFMVFLEMKFRFLLGRNKIARLLLHYILSLPLFYFLELNSSTTISGKIIHVPCKTGLESWWVGMILTLPFWFES